MSTGQSESATANHDEGARRHARFICNAHQEQLLPAPDGQTVVCVRGCSIPVVDGIARFVASDNYANAFGVQWNAFRRTQLDSFTGRPISRARLTRLLGGSLAIVKDKLVLEAGCGAGRFTEILLAAGAHVLAADLSSAVDANRQNCGRFSNYQVVQADIRHLPVAPAQFDIVICVGVVQHTPDPEETMRALCEYLKPGGLLVMDHYAPGTHPGLSRELLRRYLLRRSPGFGLRFCEGLVTMLWPAHQFAWRIRSVPVAARFRSLLLKASPVVDYHDSYAELGPELLRSWAVLDTHDALTDRFKHLRSADEIGRHLVACGMNSVEAVYGGNGVEVRASKPLQPSSTT
jgi:SAM-dependent methyltransferase